MQGGKTEWLDIEPDYALAFRRVLGDKSLLFVGNFSTEATEVSIETNGDVLLFNGADVSDGKVNLSKYGYAVWEEQ